MNRKKLLKVIGKELEYTATFEKICDFGENVCLVDVKHKGKVLTDHIWTGLTDNLAQFNEGDELKFKATARTYKDRKGNRKNGLYKCYNFRRVDNPVEIAMQDTKYRIKRLKCQKKI